MFRNFEMDDLCMSLNLFIYFFSSYLWNRKRHSITQTSARAHKKYVYIYIEIKRKKAIKICEKYWPHSRCNNDQFYCFLQCPLQLNMNWIILNWIQPNPIASSANCIQVLNENSHFVTRGDVAENAFTNYKWLSIRLEWIDVALNGFSEHFKISKAWVACPWCCIWTAIFYQRCYVIEYWLARSVSQWVTYSTTLFPEIVFCLHWWTIFKFCSPFIPLMLEVQCFRAFCDEKSKFKVLNLPSSNWSLRLRSCACIGIVLFLLRLGIELNLIAENFNIKFYLRNRSLAKKKMLHLHISVKWNKSFFFWKAWALFTFCALHAYHQSNCVDTENMQNAARK